MQTEQMGASQFDRVYELELIRIGITADQLKRPLSDEEREIYYENKLEREARKFEKQAYRNQICQPRKQC
jgi:hypothetical protein